MIDRWDTGALDTMADSLGKRTTVVAEVEAGLRAAGQLPGWFGEGGDAGRELYKLTADSLLDEAAVLGAARQLATMTSIAVSHIKSRVSALRSEAFAAGMGVMANGDVVMDQNVLPADEMAAKTALRDELQTALRALIAQAADIDADAQRIFTAIREGKVNAGDATNFDEAAAIGARQGELSAPMPPPDSTPGRAKAYWDALPEDQRDEILRDHPDWVGNLNGIPSPARHEANMTRLDSEQNRLELRRDELQKVLGGNITGGLLTNEDAELTHTVKKLEDIGKLRELIGGNEWNADGEINGRMLLLMDMESGEQGMAAVAVGNPDVADHIAVTTPGVNTTVRGGLGGMTNEADALREETIKQLALDGRKHETVSTIAWLGYEPPSGDGSRLPFFEHAETAQQDRAKDGADDLSDFYRTLDVVSTKGDPHIAAFGHSYGSLTQGLALQDGAHPVDDAVFYGSPGFEAEDEPELGLRQGHGYVMEGSDDDIKYTKSRGVLDLNGPNPTETHLVQLATGETVSPDGTRHDASRSHAEYTRDGSNGELRTSGYNLAVILAGIPELAVPR